MFDFLFPTHPFGGHTLRLVAQAQQGGGDIFDIARAMKNIEAGDRDGWEQQWLALGQKTEARARQALAAGHRRSAEQNFFHASNYYRMSDALLTIAEEPKRRERSANRRKTFAKRSSCTNPRLKSSAYVAATRSTTAISAIR